MSSNKTNSSEPLDSLRSVRGRGDDECEASPAEPPPGAQSWLRRARHESFYQGNVSRTNSQLNIPWSCVRVDLWVASGRGVSGEVTVGEAALAPRTSPQGLQ
ncbi:hypothetical protein E2C01_069121 [Portunus trituberculatus]|uniref:Uncharacterized protein n=1 Tax=Portunus trituberculatus TaxID=210409 RepID=A0A5B7HYE4_PORTR|nr:hypothetical protein [Portunus trituberculatus]